MKKNSSLLEEQVEKNSRSISLMEQTLQYMKEGIDDIKKDISDLKNDLTNGFVNKDQFSALKDEVEELKKLKNFTIKTIVGAIILSLLAYIGLKI